MANPFKGEVQIEGEGGKKYKFVLGMYGQVVLEELSGESWPAFWQRSKDWKTKDILNLFRAGLARHHEDMSKQEIADLMDYITPPGVVEIFNEAVRKAMPPTPAEAEPMREDAKESDRPLKKPRVAHASIT